MFYYIALKTFLFTTNFDDMKLKSSYLGLIKHMIEMKMSIYGYKYICKVDYPTSDRNLEI